MDIKVRADNVYQKAEGLIEKCGKAILIFRSLPDSQALGSVQLLLSIKDLAPEMRVIFDTVGNLFIGVADGCRATITQLPAYFRAGDGGIGSSSLQAISSRARAAKSGVTSVLNSLE